MTTTNRTVKPTATILKNIKALAEDVTLSETDRAKLRNKTYDLVYAQENRGVYKSVFATANDAYEWGVAVRTSVTEAAEKGGKARAEWLASESTRLRAAVRAEGPAAGTYEHELATMRGR